ncbi:MAG: sensor histidine kinase [Cyclobacteriaceae bacterium]
MQLTIGASCLLCAHWFRLVIKKRNWFALPLLRLSLYLLAGSLVAAFVAQVIIHLVMLTVLNWQTVRPIDWSEFPFYLANVFLVMIVWSGFYFGYYNFENARNAKVEAVKAEAAIKEAELIALKAQVNPHFLFNALNNIRALVLMNPHASRDAISNLSDLLRYSIRFSQQSQVMLIEEVEVVKNYLQLESIHYEKRLTYCFDIDPQTEKLLIPPMSLQVMAENAIKHGISQLEGGGMILLRTQIKDGLHLMVENTGHLRNNEFSGTGLRNVLERVRILYGEKPAFSLTQNSDRVVAHLILPIYDQNPAD